MRDRCAALRTLFQCVCTLHRNRIGQLSPFSEYAPTAGWIKPKSTATFKGACYPRSEAAGIAAGRPSQRAPAVRYPDRRHQCAHRRMGRMRGAYPTPEIPRTRVSDSHTDGLVKSSVGDTFIPTKSATPAMPHTWSDGPCGAKDFSTLALSPRRTTRPQPRYSRGS